MNLSDRFTEWLERNEPKLNKIMYTILVLCFLYFFGRFTIGIIFNM
jgi:hypothetical protein